MRISDWSSDVCSSNLGPRHIADTKEQAYKDVVFGLPQWLDYFQRVAALPLGVEADDPAEMADAMNASGFAVIGTVDDAKAQIQRLIDQSGGFGPFRTLAQEGQTQPAYVAP